MWRLVLKLLCDSDQPIDDCSKRSWHGSGCGPKFSQNSWPLRGRELAPAHSPASPCPTTQPGPSCSQRCFLKTWSEVLPVTHCIFCWLCHSSAENDAGGFLWLKKCLSVGSACPSPEFSLFLNRTHRSWRCESYSNWTTSYLPCDLDRNSYLQNIVFYLC